MINKSIAKQVGVKFEAHTFHSPKKFVFQIYKRGDENSSSHNPRSMITAISRCNRSSPTISWRNTIDVDETFRNFLSHMNERNVNVEQATENFFEIRRLTNFSWKDLAAMLNVDRRSVFNWVSGSKIRNSNKEHIARTLEVLRFADRGFSEINASCLKTFFAGSSTSPFEAIRSKQYEVAKRFLGPGKARRIIPNTYINPDSATGEFQPIWNHFETDGDDKIKPLPYEPQKSYQIRSLNRN